MAWDSVRQGKTSVSYGFRPKRGQHNALDALVVGITTTRLNFIFDADVAAARSVP
jgi:hypothetical protein